MILPAILQPFESQIQETLKPYIKISLKESENISLTNSKVGGHPYWPVNEPYPVSPEHEPLRLLAQINFSEIPQGIEELPTTGLLQFFLASDDLYGMDFDEPATQEGFRVVYHETTEAPALDDFSFLDAISYDEFPLGEGLELAMSFDIKEAAMSSETYDFDAHFGEEFLENDDLMEAYYELFSGLKHRIGGYPGFTQFDPRDDDTPFDFLLFQLDSETVGSQEILWGDVGIGNFFINTDDLKQKNFSHVLYNWDCG